MRIVTSLAIILIAAFPAAAAERTATFSVPGMTCPLCPITVSTAIKKLDGIVSVATDAAVKTATVVFDDTRTDPAKIAKASENAGYPASIMSVK
jgi:mercuric ion binding protein